MCYRIDQRLEHGTLTEPLAVDPGRCPGCTCHHISTYEIQRILNLRVEWTSDGAGVSLIVDIRTLTRVTDGLYVRVRKPLLRFART